jgi:hypothetical protein
VDAVEPEASRSEDRVRIECRIADVVALSPAAPTAAGCLSRVSRPVPVGPSPTGRGGARRKDAGLLVLYLSVLAAGLAAPASTSARPASSGGEITDEMPVPVAIAWSMADRFGPGYDRNRDGRPDLPNSFGYVNPGHYEIQLEAVVDPVGAPAGGISCDWTIDGPEGATSLRAAGLRPVVRLPQGRHSVTVAIRLADGRSGSARETILVKDFLIVALGDSMATGEGNPEEPARWDEARASVGAGSSVLCRAAAGLIGLALIALSSVYAARRSAGRRGGTREGRRGAVRARAVILGLLGGGAMFDALIGFGWAFRGRVDPPTPALWADGGPGGDQPRVTPAGVLPPASVLHTRAHR